MQHITDAMIDELVEGQDAQRVLTEAFASFGHGEAAMQERIRTESGGVKLSTLGAVLPTQGFTGAKVYTTINGNFNFVILLFSSVDGKPLASFDAAAITRLRTAASSVIAGRYLANPDSKNLALFGAGTQGKAHAVQMAKAWPLSEIRVCDPYAPASLAADLAKACGVFVRMATAAEALDGADIVVTASRALTPLFSGKQLVPGTFVAAIGSSLPHTRELDDEALIRASLIAVDWKDQTLHEAGDLVLAGAGVLGPSKVVNLSDLIVGRSCGRTSPDEIMIYKSVGVGLQDIAVAGLAWQRFTGLKRDATETIVDP